MTGLSALGLAATGATTPAIALGVIALLVLWLTGAGVLPHILAERLQHGFATKRASETKLGSSVCIILLGEGTALDPETGERTPSWIAGSRIVSAAALYHAAVKAGVDCRIVVAGERIRGDRAPASGAYPRALQALGVADSQIDAVEGVNTFEHAKHISGTMKMRRPETTLLVTSALHMKRALLFFDAFDLRPIPFPSDRINVPRLPIPIGYNFAVGDIALHQYLAIVRFHIYQATGRNRHHYR